MLAYLPEQRASVHPRCEVCGAEAGLEGWGPGGEGEGEIIIASSFLYGGISTVVIVRWCKSCSVVLVMNVTLLLLVSWRYCQKANSKHRRLHIKPINVDHGNERVRRPGTDRTHGV